MKCIKRLFGLIKQYRRGQTKTFRNLYDFCMRHLEDGEESVSVGNLFVHMRPAGEMEYDIDIDVKINTATTVRYNAIKVRQRIFAPDEISIYADKKKGCLVYVYVDEKSRLYRCKFGMNAPLKKLKRVFKNRYVNYITNSLTFYDLK